MSTTLADEDFARRAAELAERAGAEHPTTWRPNDPAKEHPQLLVGVLVRVDEGHTSYGPARIVVLRVDGREWGVWLLHQVLRDEFARLRPCAGELVAVKYAGKVEPRDGRDAYESYRVVVDRDAGGIDWSGGPAASAELAAVICAQCGCTEPEHGPGCIPF